LKNIGIESQLLKPAITFATVTDSNQAFEKRALKLNFMTTFSGFFCRIS